MNNIPKIIKNIILFTLLSFGLFFLTINFFIINKIPDVFYSVSNSEIILKSPIPFLKFKMYPQNNFIMANSNNEHEYSLKLFGITLKKLKVKITQRQRTRPCGIPFGIKIFTDGVMVINTSSVETVSGSINTCPSIKKGDVITHANGSQINTNEEFSKEIENSCGNPLDVTVIRGNIKFNTNINPVKPVGEDSFKAGIWVRDGSAGIGMITFFIKDKNFFVGLGHGVRDIDTNELIPLSHGDVMKATIKGITKSTKENTGELRGSFVGFEPIGKIISNDDSGVYGILNNEICSETDQMDIAFKQEIKTGPAKILSTVLGNTPKLYDINIDKINFDKYNPNKNICISVCDEELINQTGGVVQGMSGSPIIQNGVLVGAITHVVSNNPRKGYGIFAETMMNNSNSF